MAEFYKMNPAQWDFGTASLTLEQEAAYLRVVNAINKHDAPVPDNPHVLAGMFRCNTRRAKRLLDDLVAAGKLWVEGGKITAQFRPDPCGPPTRSPLPVVVRQMVMERDGWRCVYCDDTDGPHEVDHIFPVSLGGSDDIDNLACACRLCNRSKGALTIEEWEGA